METNQIEPNTWYLIDEHFSNGFKHILEARWDYSGVVLRNIMIDQNNNMNQSCSITYIINGYIVIRNGRFTLV